MSGPGLTYFLEKSTYITKRWLFLSTATSHKPLNGLIWMLSTLAPARFNFSKTGAMSCSERLWHFTQLSLPSLKAWEEEAKARMMTLPTMPIRILLVVFTRYSCTLFLLLILHLLLIPHGR